MKNLFMNVFAKLFSITNARYVNRFVPIKQEYGQLQSSIGTKDQQEAFDNLAKGIKNIEHMIDKYPFIKEMDETLFIDVIDLDNFKLTVQAKDGKGTISIGWQQDKKPSFVLPLYSSNLKHVREITDDGEIGLNDAYRFIRVLFLPFLCGLYQGDYSHLPKDKSYLQLDNFIHVEVKNEDGLEVEGFSGPARATVVNVDGQWLIFEGFQGDPDVKYSMNVKQALEFAYLIRVKLMQGGIRATWKELEEVVKRYNDLKKQVLTYERKWHTIEELH